MRRMRWWTPAALVFVIYSCAGRKATTSTQPPPPTPVQRSTVGVASWYGPGFHGKRTANGEIYNQEDLTAASPTLPLGTVVAVTNLRNGRSVLVRINDRGPYVKGRHIDLSHKAASVLGMIGPGTAPVRIDVLRVGSNRSPASKHHRYYVQVGLFNNLAAAKRLQANLLAAYPDVAIDRVKLGHHRYYRVRMGNFTTWDQALARAHQTVNPRFPVVIGRE